MRAGPVSRRCTWKGALPIHCLALAKLPVTSHPCSKVPKKSRQYPLCPSSRPSPTTTLSEVSDKERIESNYTRIYFPASPTSASHFYDVLQLTKLFHINYLLLTLTVTLKVEEQKSSVQFSCSVMFDSLRPHGPQHARPPCPSPTPGVYSNSCPLSR